MLAERGFGGYLCCREAMPCCGGLPPTAVGITVFKVAVLHHLGIQASIGSITDILEKHTYQLVADGFLFIAFYLQRGMQHLAFGQHHGLCLFLQVDQGATVFLSLLCKMLAYALCPSVGQCYPVANDGFASHRHGVLLGFHSLILLLCGRHIGCKMPHLGIGSKFAVAALRCFEHHRKGAIGIGCHHRSHTALDGGVRIVLRSPVHPVIAHCHGKAGREVVDLKHSHCPALCSAPYHRTVHFFL